MSKIKISNLKKAYGTRVILDIEDFVLNKGDKIGLVGENGSGKSSFLKILASREDYSGELVRTASIAYMDQMDLEPDEFIKGELPSIFKIESSYRKGFSGGEKTKYGLASVLSKNKEVLLLDEPTNNLDLESIETLIELLDQEVESFIVVSHNRDFLDRVCNRIVEIEDGKMSFYNGNYSFYRRQKEEEIEKARSDYKNYRLEKKRLEDSILDIEGRSASVRRAPKRMGNSEARLHRMGGQKQKKHLDGAKKSIKTRLEKLEAVEKPREEETLAIDLREENKIYSKKLISGSNINIAFGERQILKDARFTVKNHSKVGLVGRNASGKTSLIKILMEDESIRRHPNLKIGYFAQNIGLKRSEKTILDYIMEDSIYDENFSRLILARLLFRGEDVYKKIDRLSGGELVRLEIGRLVLGDYNLLILDEITNHIDIKSIVALEDTLKSYRGNLILVSHDRMFLDNIVDSLLIIEDRKLISFQGNYRDYLDSKSLRENKKDYDEELLSFRLTELISKLSLEEDEARKKELDREYTELLAQAEKYRNK